MKALTLDASPLRWVVCKALAALTPSAYWSAVSNLRFQEIAEPQLPGESWVRLRTILGGICGTDLAAVMQRVHPASVLQHFTRFPVVLGHENVAVVEDVGADVTGWRCGERVVVEPALSCAARGITPPCASCAAGCFSLCDNFIGDGNLPAGLMIGMNQFTSGSWAPRFVAHVSQLHRVPDGLSDEEAVLIDPLACSLHAVLRQTPAEGERVLVQGGGIIGLGIVMALRALGHHNEVIAFVRHPHQAERMVAAGASRTLIGSRKQSKAAHFEAAAGALSSRRVTSRFGNQSLIGGADLVYDCVGTGRSLTDAMKFCRSRGTVVAVGTSQISVVDTTSLWFSELRVLGANGRQMERRDTEIIHTYDWVMELMNSGRLSAKGLLTHVFPLERYRTAFSALLQRGRSKVLKAAFSH